MASDEKRAVHRKVSIEHVAAALQFVDELVLALDADGTITFVSPSIKHVLGWDPADLLGRNVIDFLPQEDIGEIVHNLARWVGREGELHANPLRVRTPTGIYVETAYFVVTGPQVADLGDYVITLKRSEDTDDEHAELLYRLANEGRLVRLARTFLGLRVDDFQRGLDDAVTEIAGLRWVTRVSIWQRVERHLVLRSSWVADDHAPTVPLPDRVPVANFPQLEALQEVHHRTPDEIVEGGHWVEGGRVLVGAGVTELLAVPIRVGDRFSGIVLVEQTFGEGEFDSTHFSTLRAAAAILGEAFARNDAEHELALRATTDHLTGLPNRWLFQRRLEAALERAAADPSYGVGVALFDLDRFKMVNDSLGHDAGDRLLVKLGERLLTAVAGAATAGASGAGAGPGAGTSQAGAGTTAEETVVARHGGDEFLLLVAGCADSTEAEARVAAVIGSLGPPFDVDGQPVQLTASAGLAFVLGERATEQELLRRADIAMSRVKHRGGAQIASSEREQDDMVADRLAAEGLLREAIADGHLVAYLQGEWELATGALVGAEALARWQHPTLGVRPAADFIDLAEESDLVLSLGERILQTSCDQLATWRRSGFTTPFVLRVNLSARQLRHPGMVEQIGDALAASGLAPADLCLELTESSLLTDPQAAAKTLGQIRDLGCGLAVDDFGTGYSSLLYLKNLPLTCIKIDRVFVAGLPHDTTDRAIISTIVQLASNLGVTVTAEGVETEDQRDALLEIGCGWAQGYLFSRPEPFEDFGRRLAFSPASGEARAGK